MIYLLLKYFSHQFLTLKIAEVEIKNATDGTMAFKNGSGSLDIIKNTTIAK